METIVLYHANCIDGFGAALAAWMKLGGTAEYIAVNYDELPPDIAEKTVFVLDFSYKRNILITMSHVAKSITIIDHHKTAQEELSGLDYAHFDMTKSGAVLAWEYFHPGAKIPRLFQLIQDRDLWKFEIPGTKDFTSALFSLVDRSFTAWSFLLDDKRIDDLITSGAALNLVFDKEVATLINRSHEMVINGISGLGCNATPKYSSELGNKLAEKSGTFGATYCFDGKRLLWDVSLRSIGDFDVSAIAKLFGGGGHKNAAGFTVERLS